ncbi:hypothetical protein E2P81_ATG04570 [Venturia nashicola]|nr:hypothetical protein E2P81_ATG04570 [Venturia nashicola]
MDSQSMRLTSLRNREYVSSTATAARQDEPSDIINEQSGQGEGFLKAHEIPERSGFECYIRQTRGRGHCDTPLPNARIIVGFREGPCQACDATRQMALQEQTRILQEEHEAREKREQEALKSMTVDPSLWPQEYGTITDFEQGNAQGWAAQSLMPGEKTPEREEEQGAEEQNTQEAV